MKSSYRVACTSFIITAALSLMITLQRLSDDKAVNLSPVNWSSCAKKTILCNLEINQTTPAKKRLESLGQLKQQFHRLLLLEEKTLCKRVRHFGGISGGGYDVCMTSPFKPEPQSCLVYSFGISHDWTFDEAAAEYGCEVHSFDPSLRLKDHLRKFNVHFHNMGLWGDDIISNNRWALNTLSTIRKNLGHGKRIIDVLKIDAEGAEWPFLRDVLHKDTDQLRTVKQLVLELHPPVLRGHRLTVANMHEIIYYINRLKEVGFTLFQSQALYNCCAQFARWSPTGIEEKCCREVFFVNARFWQISNLTR